MTFVSSFVGVLRKTLFEFSLGKFSCEFAPHTFTFFLLTCWCSFKTKQFLTLEREEFGAEKLEK